MFKNPAIYIEPDFFTLINLKKQKYLIGFLTKFGIKPILEV